MADRAELIISALQQRIGEIVSNYETQVAFLRAEITELVQEKENWRKDINEYSNSLIEKISDPSDADLFTEE
jgi:flagellar biosynthesis chaperone FliJ